MTDKTDLKAAEKAIRDALAAGPTPGKRKVRNQCEVFIGARRLCAVNAAESLGLGAEVARRGANAAFVAACDPAALTLLLAELDRLRAALAAAPAAYPLPDDLYAGSKDWAHGDYAQRVEWLHTAYESTKAERDMLLQQLAAPAAPAAGEGA